MKVVDISLSRDTGYTGTMAARLSAPWKATIYVESTAGGSYPDQREVPADLSKKMADAAFAALVESGWFQPDFLSGIVEPEERPAPVPAQAAELGEPRRHADDEPL